MKKCIICKKQIDKKEEFCQSCSDFFEWKYGKNFREHFEYLIEKDLAQNSESIKFRRLNK